MVVKLRLSRWGASHNPFYKIVAINSKRARDGKCIQELGTYNPIPDSKGVKHITINVDKCKYWIGVGAQPSDRVHWLLSKLNILPPHPKYLKEICISDSKTWNVTIKDSNGNLLKENIPMITALEEFPLLKW
jgi:small subunit ribosomal protein S16